MNLTKKINLPNKDINLTPSVTNHSPTVQSRLLSFLLTKKQRSSNFAHRLASKMRFESLPIEIKPPIPCAVVSRNLERFEHQIHHFTWSEACTRWLSLFPRRAGLRKIDPRIDDRRYRMGILLRRGLVDRPKDNSRFEPIVSVRKHLCVHHNRHLTSFSFASLSLSYAAWSRVLIL